MYAIYTTCTVNHLSRAFSLLESVGEYHPEIRFIICIVDTVKKDSLPAGDYEIVFAEDMKLSFFKEMCIKYSTLELNSALKPYFAKFILDENPQIDKLVYLDSDILLFHRFDIVFDALEEKSIIITPHSQSTIEPRFVFDDRDFLRSGVYNAGFFAIRRDDNAISFLEWWKGKLRNQGFFDPRRGMFAEQLWMNLIPLYFDNVLVMLHKGCNVAYWNLHERIIIKKDENYFVNDNIPLIFFHFSGAGLDCFEKNNPSKTQDRWTFSNRPDIIPIFERYVESLRKHSMPELDSLHTITGNLRTRSRLIKSIVEFGRKGVKKLIFLK